VSGEGRAVACVRLCLRTLERGGADLHAVVELGRERVRVVADRACGGEDSTQCWSGEDESIAREGEESAPAGDWRVLWRVGVGVRQGGGIILLSSGPFAPYMSMPSRPPPPTAHAKAKGTRHDGGTLTRASGAQLT
jgi:hypothetical protein